MARKSNIRKKYPYLILVLFILIWWGLPFGYKLLLKSSFEEFQAPIWELSSRLDDLGNFWGHRADSKNTLIEKNRELSRLKSDIEQQIERSNNLELEIERLNNLKKRIVNLNRSIGLDQENKFIPEIARVSVRKINSWWQQITIRKGSKFFLKEGQGVIYRDGIMGRVIRVGSRSSEIELITNPTFRIVAHVENDSRPVHFQGNGINWKGQPQGIVRDVPQDIKLTPNNELKLISSSLGGNYPSGILIGMIHQLEGDENGLFKTGTVLINRNLNRAQEVTVLISKDNDSL